MKKYFPYLILFSALSVSISAAFYSVYGLSKFYAGSASQVMIMAGSLEVAKLIVASALHRYWKPMHSLMKVYLTIAVVVLIGVTSWGIYGFLIDAYQATAVKESIRNKGIELVESKKNRYNSRINEYKLELEQVSDDISGLRASMASLSSVDNRTQWVDTLTKKVITQQSSAGRREVAKQRESFQNQLYDAIEKRDGISVSIESYTDSVFMLETQVAKLDISATESSELGPLKHVADLTGRPMDYVVNWFTLILIVVFDPLAVVMIITANFAFEQRDNELKAQQELEEQEDEKREDEEDEPVPEPEPKEDDIPEKPETPEELSIEFLAGIPDIDKIPPETEVTGSSETVSEATGSFDVEPAIHRKIREVFKIPSTTKRLTSDQIKNMSHQEVKRWQDAHRES